MEGYEVETSSKITPSSIEGYSEYLVKGNLFDIPTHPLKFKDMSITKWVFKIQNVSCVITFINNY